MEEQTNFASWDWSDEIEKIKQKEKEIEAKRGSVLQDGETLHISDVVYVEEKVMEFMRADGTPRKVTRYIYHFKDGSTKIVPWEVHRQIGKQVEKFGKNIDVVVSRTQVGSERWQVKYTVTAIVRPR